MVRRKNANPFHVKIHNGNVELKDHLLSNDFTLT